MYIYLFMHNNLYNTKTKVPVVEMEHVCITFTLKVNGPTF